MKPGELRVVIVDDNKDAAALLGSQARSVKSFLWFTPQLLNPVIQKSCIPAKVGPAWSDKAF